MTRAPEPGDGPGWRGLLNREAQKRAMVCPWPTIPWWEFPGYIGASDPPWRLALQLLGVPFVHMGRTPWGVDCVGTLVLTAWAQGQQVVDSDYYGREPDYRNGSFGLLNYLRENCGAPVTREPQVNDIVALKLRPRFAPTHVGILAPHKTGGLALIHANGSVGHVSYHRLDQKMAELVVEVYQWPEKH